VRRQPGNREPGSPRARDGCELAALLASLRCLAGETLRVSLLPTRSLPVARGNVVTPGERPAPSSPTHRTATAPHRGRTASSRLPSRLSHGLRPFDIEATASPRLRGFARALTAARGLRRAPSRRLRRRASLGRERACSSLARVPRARRGGVSAGLEECVDECPRLEGENRYCGRVTVLVWLVTAAVATSTSAR
jgi:hypothetical protein